MQRLMLQKNNDMDSCTVGEKIVSSLSYYRDMHHRTMLLLSMKESLVDVGTQP